MTPTWDILIASLAGRTDTLTELLKVLRPQMTPGVGVHVYRDNMEHGYAEKCQALLDSSKADYISYIDDDDLVPDDFVETVMAALEHDPDQVGFRVRYTEDGRPMLPVVHTLEAGGWHDTAEGLYRDFTQFNPIRRSLAMPWEDHGGTSDRVRADAMRQKHQGLTEVFVDRELYFYRHRSDLGWFAVTDPPPQPRYKFVAWL